MSGCICSCRSCSPPIRKSVWRVTRQWWIKMKSSRSSCLTSTPKMLRCQPSLSLPPRGKFKNSISISVSCIVKLLWSKTLFGCSWFWFAQHLICFLQCIRYEMLQDNVEGYRKEIASLREKEQKMATTSQKHEQTIHTLSQDLRAAKEKLAMAEVCFPSSVFLNFHVIIDGNYRCAWFEFLSNEGTLWYFGLVPLL